MCKNVGEFQVELNNSKTHNPCNNISVMCVWSMYICRYVYVEWGKAYIERSIHIHMIPFHVVTKGDKGKEDEKVNSPKETRLSTLLTYTESE